MQSRVRLYSLKVKRMYSKTDRRACASKARDVQWGTRRHWKQTHITAVWFPIISSSLIVRSELSIRRGKGLLRINICTSTKWPPTYRHKELWYDWWVSALWHRCLCVQTLAYQLSPPRIYCRSKHRHDYFARVCCNWMLLANISTHGTLIDMLLPLLYLLCNVPFPFLSSNILHRIN